MKKRNFPAVCMLIFTVGVIAAAHLTTGKNANLESPVTVLSANMERPQKLVEKTVTLSENAESEELCHISGQDELTVSFTSTRGPRRVHVTILEGETVAGEKELQLQDSLSLDIDPKKAYTLEASLTPHTDYCSGGKVTFKISYSKK